MNPLETVPALLFAFYTTSPLSHPPFFFLSSPSAPGEDEALEFARICFPAAARALRWIEGICMGRGGELVRHVRENRRNVTAEAQQMRAVEKRGEEG